MGTLIHRSRVLAVISLLVLAGCGRHGTVYAVATDAARQDLVGTIIPDLAFGNSAHAEPAVGTADGVEWHIVRGDDAAALPGGTPSREIMVLSATLANADEGTLVSVDVKPAAGVDSKAFEQNMSDNPAVADMFRAIAREAVDAGLSHRPFEFGNVSAQIAMATVSMLPQITQQMDEAARAYEQRDRDTIDDAYRRESGQ